MNSIQPVLNTYLPMSLVPRQPLKNFPDNVPKGQWRVSDRHILALRIDKFFVYYESKLIRDV